ncbi:uncharacterized protein LOC131944434 [Physella acuta]|uniref:uncharacterized protein LOC131944434 n=1 Tax=Physella acuta TaxID=109671 RepID=UPI0027DACA3D|nr:uncharacterized protein LOC131944434 [Physella acuta]
MASTNKVSPRKQWGSDITSPVKKYRKRPLSTIETQTWPVLTKEPTNSFTKQPAKRFAQEATNDFTREPTYSFTQEPTNGFTKEQTNSFAQEPTNAFTKESANDFTREPTYSFTQESTNGFTKEPTNSLTKDLTNGFSKEPTNFFTNEPTNGFKEESTNRFTREATNSFAQEPTIDFTRAPTNRLTKESKNGFRKELTVGFTNESTRNSSKRLPKKSTRKSSKVFTKDSKQLFKKEWNIKISTKLALYLFANTNDGTGIYSERNDFIKDLLKFVVNNEFWLFVESNSEDYLKSVHKCLIQSSFEAKEHDPAIFGRSSCVPRGKRQNDFCKDYFLFDLDGNRYLKNEEQNNLEAFKTNKITFQSAIFMNDTNRDFESIVYQCKSNIPVVLMKDIDKSTEALWKKLDSLKMLTKELKEKLISIFTIEGRYDKEKDDIARIILSAIRKTIPALNNHRLDGNLNSQTTSSSYSDRDQSVPDTSRSLSEVKFSTDDQPTTNTKLPTDQTAATGKASKTLEYFLLCLKVNCLEKAREFADIWQWDSELTSQVINQAVADDCSDFIRLILEEDLHILEYIDQGVFSKNRHHCKYHLPGTTFKNSEKVGWFQYDSVSLIALNKHRPVELQLEVTELQANERHRDQFKEGRLGFYKFLPNEEFPNI